LTPLAALLNAKVNCRYFSLFISSPTRRNKSFSEPKVKFYDGTQFFEEREKLGHGGEVYHQEMEAKNEEQRQRVKRTMDARATLIM